MNIKKYTHLLAVSVPLLIPALALCNSPEVFLEAAPQLVRPGDRVFLRWEVRNAESVTLDGVPEKHVGRRLIRPTESRKFTLSAKKGFEEVTTTATVTVAEPRITDLELCGAVGELNSQFRCFSRGPFTSANRIHAIVRFANLTAGPHRLRRRIFEVRQGSWKEVHKETSTLNNPRAGSLEVSFQLPRLGAGRRKFEVTLDGQVRKSILY